MMETLTVDLDDVLIEVARCQTLFINTFVRQPREREGSCRDAYLFLDTLCDFETWYLIIGGQ
jgi:hypothetical protein